MSRFLWFTVYVSLVIVSELETQSLLKPNLRSLLLRRNRRYRLVTLTNATYKIVSVRVPTLTR